MPKETVITQILNKIQQRIETRKLMEAEIIEEDEQENKKKGRDVRRGIEFDRGQYRKWIENFYFAGATYETTQTNSDAGDIDEDKTKLD